MRKRRKGSGSVPCKRRRSASLTILCIAFSVGILFGCAFAGTLSEEENSSLKSYVISYLSATENGSMAAPEPFSSFWNTYQWPIGILLCSFTAIGVLGIPLLLAVKGFLLSFTVSCFIRVLGSSGVILSALLFGLSALFSLPALFLLGVQGLELSLALSRKMLGKNSKKLPLDNEYWLRCGIGILLLWFSMAIERGVVPPLLHRLAGTF